MPQLPTEMFWLRASQFGLPDARLVTSFWDLETRLQDWYVTDFGKCLTRADASQIVHAVTDMLISCFDAALEGGKWRIMARVDHSQAAFELIPYDVWRSYSTIDGSRNIARTGKGNYLFSVHCELLLSRPTPQSQAPFPHKVKKTRGAKFANAEKAIVALYGAPPLIEMVSGETLVADVRSWCEKHNPPLQIPGRDTILRAAGRLKYG